MDKPGRSDLSKADDKSLSVGRHGLESDRLADFVQGLNQPGKMAVEGGSLSTGEKLQVLSESALTGMFSHGYKEITEHPLRLAAETGGAYALSLALKGPAWTRVPALTVASVGMVTYGVQTVQAASESARILDSANRANLSQTREALAANLGPLAFNTALMGLTARLGTQTENLPREMPVSWKVKLDNLARLGDDLLLPPGAAPHMKLAFADGVSPHYVPGANLAEKNVMKMTGQARGSGERIMTGRGAYGETVHRLENLQGNERVPIQHIDGASTTFDGGGKVMVNFTSGEARLLDLGYGVKHVVASDYAQGVRHYRINGSATPNMEVNPQGHTVRAVLANGEHLHMVDNAAGSHVYFPHRDGTKTWVEYNGRLVMELPGGVVEHKFNDALAHVRLVERSDGSKQFRFLDQDGNLLPHVVELPATSNLTAQETLKYLKGLPSNQRQAGLNHAELEMLRYSSSQGGVVHTSGQQDHVGRMIPRGPGSFDRIMDRHIAGVDTRVMRGDRLDSPSQMGLAQQGHSWLVTRYLNRLNSHD